MKITNCFIVFSFFCVFGTAIGKNGDEKHSIVDDDQPQLQQQQEYCVPDIEQDPQILSELGLDAKDWALSNGLVMLINEGCTSCGKSTKNFVTQHMPVAMFPSPFPKKLFEQAVEVQKAMLLLYFRVSTDFKFLKEVHRQVIEMEGPNKIKHLVQQIEQMHNETIIRQPLAMICQRADYMANQNEDGKYVLKQVEVNTGAVGSFGTSPRVSRLHRRMLENAGVDASDAVKPLANTDRMIAETLYQAWLQFANPKAVILVMHESIYSHIIIESRQIEHQLEQISAEPIQCRFLTMEDALKRLKVDPNNFTLILDDKYVVAVVYDRVNGGLSPQEFQLNMAIERSTAIKTPPYVFALSHTKKMQQYLTKPGVVERFFTDPKEAHLAEQIRKVQTKAWALGDDKEEAEEIKKKASKNPKGYVLKNNECGGIGPRIFFDEDIPKKLARMTPAEHNYFFIMEKLRPMVIKNHFVRPNMKPLLNVEATPELGIFGCLIGNMITGEVTYMSDTNNHMMKSKRADVNEGGVLRGNSVCDSPYLV